MSCGMHSGSHVVFQLVPEDATGFSRLSASFLAAISYASTWTAATRLLRLSMNYGSADVWPAALWLLIF